MGLLPFQVYEKRNWGTEHLLFKGLGRVRVKELRAKLVYAVEEVPGLRELFQIGKESNAKRRKEVRGAFDYIAENPEEILIKS